MIRPSHRAVLCLVLGCWGIASGLLADGGSLVVMSRPEGAVAGSVQTGFGPTPVTFTNLASGVLRIGIRCNGYFPEERIVQIQTGQATRIDVNLRPLHGGGKTARILQAEVFGPDGASLGVFDSLGRALETAVDGSEIRVQPGIYRESLTIEKSVTLVAPGRLGETVVSAGRVEIAAGAEVRITGINFERTSGGRGAFFRVENSSLKLDSCIIRGRGSVLLLAQGPEASAVLSGVQLEALSGAGAVGVDGARLELNQCQASAVEGNGLEWSRGASGGAWRSKVEDCGHAGILVHAGARADIVDCEIAFNFGPGLEVRTGGAPVVRDTHFSEGNSGGIFIGRGGGGHFESCTVTGNEGPGIEIAGAGDVRFERVHLEHNEQAGIFIHEESSARFKDVSVFMNRQAGIEVTGKAAPIFAGGRVENNMGAGILVHEEGGGRFERIEIIGNRLAGLEVRGGAVPVFDSARMAGNRQAGILVHLAGKLDLNQCVVERNGSHGIEVRDGGVLRGSNSVVSVNAYHGLVLPKELWPLVLNFRAENNGRDDWADGSSIR